MTRKQWINDINDEQALKVHMHFRNFDSALADVPTIPPKHGKLGGVDWFELRRRVVRKFLRTNNLTPRHLNVQYGRLAAGLPISPNFAKM